MQIVQHDTRLGVNSLYQLLVIPSRELFQHIPCSAHGWQDNLEKKDLGPKEEQGQTMGAQGPGRKRTRGQGRPLGGGGTSTRPSKTGRRGMWAGVISAV